MIDLSYLTEEEQQMIMTVLQRDAELKRAEEERVKQLEKLPADRKKIKYLTGEWFYEAKSQRHMDRIHGSDIIRASMERKSQMTQFNPSQSWTARTRAVSNGNQDILSLQEPSRWNEKQPKQPEEERESNNASPEQERFRPAVRTPAKRQNPFNRASLVLSEPPEEMDSQLTSQALEPHEITAGESLSPLKSDIAGLTNDLCSEDPGAMQEVDTKLSPTPKKRTILFTPLDTLHDNDSSIPRWGYWRGSVSRVVPPRGIFSHSINSNSNDSGLPNEGTGRRKELPGDCINRSSAVASEGKPTEEGAEDKSLPSLYSKQEKFSLKDTARGPELPEAQEVGDRDLLNLDHPVPLDELKGETEPATGLEKNDGSNGLNLALCRSDGDQPQKDGCSADASETLMDSPCPLPSASESKFGWMAHKKFRPYLPMSPPVPEPQRQGVTSGGAQAGAGEARAEREVAAMRCDEECSPHNTFGQYETQADSTPDQVSYLPSSTKEKVKPVYGRMRSYEDPPMREVQRPEFSRGDSIAKVLEWFNRSLDGSDHQDECIYEQEVDVEIRNQPGAPEDDITRHEMVEDKDQLVVPKDNFPPADQVAEYSRVSGGSPTAEVEVSHRKRAQLERSPRSEEKIIACVEGTSKTQSSMEEKETFPESAEEEPVTLQHPVHSSLNADSVNQPDLQVSSVHTRPQSQKKENAADTTEDRGGMGSLESPPMREAKRSEFSRGDSIAKVLEWFNRSSDGSDYQEEGVYEQEVDVETRNQPRAPEDDIAKNEIIEDKDQLPVPKDDFSPAHPVEMEISPQMRTQLERSPRLKEKGIASVEGTRKTQSPIEDKETFPEEDPVILQHLAHSSNQPDLQMSSVRTRPQSQKKENTINAKEEHDWENRTILLSPVTKATQHEIKQSVPSNDSQPQSVANMKSFWERGNSSPKILISRSNATSKQNETEPVSQTAKTEMESKVNICNARQEVPTRPEETCLGNKDEKDVHETSSSKNIAEDIHNKRNTDTEDGIIEPNAQSVLPLTQEGLLGRAGSHHGEPKSFHDPECGDKPQSLEGSHLVKELDEEMYIAKCIVIDEDMEIPTPSVEGKTDLHEVPQKEEVVYGMVPLSQQVSLAKQSSSAPTVNQRPKQLDNSADKIEDFWEGENHGPQIITGQPKQEKADTNKDLSPARLVPLDSNSTKSAFDLRMIATDNKSNASPLKEGPNFTVISLKQRMEKASVDQSPSNFKNLCDFWDGTPSNSHNSQLPSSERITLSPKSPQLKSQEFRQNAQEKNQSPTKTKLPSKDLEKPSFRTHKTEKYHLTTYTIDISTPKSESKENKRFFPTQLPRQASGSSDELSMTISSPSQTTPSMETEELQKRPTVQEQQISPPQSCSERGSEQAPLLKDGPFIAQMDFQLPRRSSSEKATGRVNLSEEQLDASSEQLRSTQEELPGGGLPPQGDVVQRRPSGKSKDGGWRPKPLARSILLHDYNHYLGIPEGATFQRMPATKKEEEATSACSQPELELSVESGPVRTSTPVVSEETQARRGSEGSTPWHSHHGKDNIDLDSYGETWSNYWTSSACDKDMKSVRKALERAKLRPVSFSKSVENISLLATRPEEVRSKETNRCELMLSMDDVSEIPPSPTSFTSDPAQMKSMSKSVPAFLQKESSRRDSDSASECSVHTGRPTKMGSSLTNLSSSSGMSSVSSSVMSIYSGDFGSVEVRGTILFSINYLQNMKEFHIFVGNCRNLAAVDPEKNRSNPYVKSYLLPDQAKLGKRKTSVKKKTVNPNFNEILRYRVRFETLKTRLLNLSVWHNDTFGRNSFLGEVELDLSKWDFGNTQMNNLTLKPRVQSGFQASDNRGEMRLALRYLPDVSDGYKSSNTGEVHIWVKDCKDLPIIRGMSINPFVRCFVLPDTSRKSRQKTRVLKRTQNPSFNHTMVYDGFKTEDLPEACVELTVWDYDHIASHLVGGLRLGLGTGKSYGEVVGWMDSSADEANLWERMMDSPNQWVDDLLPLRMLTIAKNLWK